MGFMRFGGGLGLTSETQELAEDLSCLFVDAALVVELELLEGDREELVDEGEVVGFWHDLG